MEGELFAIASQGPIEKSFDDFWNMFHTTGLTKIVMLCNFAENGVAKCGRYFLEEGKTLKTDNYSVKTVIILPTIFVFLLKRILNYSFLIKKNS